MDKDALMGLVRTIKWKRAPNTIRTQKLSKRHLRRRAEKLARQNHNSTVTPDAPANPNSDASTNESE